MSRKIFLMLPLLLLVGVANAQDGKLKQLDRAKWQELVKEVNSKRYDLREKEPEYNLDPQSEYSDMERELYGDDNYTGDGSSSYGDGSGGGGGGGGTYSASEDEGIYDGSSSSDNDFFDERNDRPRDESGNGMGDGSGGGPDSRYDDEGSNSGSKYNDNSRYDRSDNSRQREIHYERSSPKSDPATRSASGGGGGDSTWLIVVMIVIVAAAVVYMIIVAFSDKNKKVKAVAETDESRIENMTITKSELELALEAALANKNYREAVRIYFIAIIKEMKDRSWIKWEKKKTNYHYINEITGRNQQPDFITATRAFEIVWYGNRSLEEGEYRQIEPHFKKLLTSIQ